MGRGQHLPRGQHLQRQAAVEEVVIVGIVGSKVHEDGPRALVDEPVGLQALQFVQRVLGLPREVHDVAPRVVPGQCQRRLPGARAVVQFVRRLVVQPAGAEGPAGRVLVVRAVIPEAVIEPVLEEGHHCAGRRRPQPHLSYTCDAQDQVCFIDKVRLVPGSFIPRVALSVVVSSPVYGWDINIFHEFVPFVDKSYILKKYISGQLCFQKLSPYRQLRLIALVNVLR
mmetsp:Transcript_4136/g.7329  ORF Transcript_4136/g.7329 Transcript_4136/m.7329 type:complete len:226 (-) Transcript_4136:246-923(-)